MTARNVGDIIDADLLARTDWTALAVIANWVNTGGGFQVAQYRKLGDEVHLRGLVSSGVSGTAVGVLPVGFRPPATFQAAGVTDALGAVNIQILGTGVINLFTASNVRVSIHCQFSVAAV